MVFLNSGEFRTKSYYFYPNVGILQSPRGYRWESPVGKPHLWAGEFVLAKKILMNLTSNLHYDITVHANNIQQYLCIPDGWKRMV